MFLPQDAKIIRAGVVMQRAALEPRLADAYIVVRRVLPGTSIRSIPEAISHPRALSLRRSWPDVHGAHLTLMASEDLPANGHGGPADPARPILRKLARAARAAYVAGLSAGERGRFERLLAGHLADRLPAGRVAAYHAVGDEIDPGRLDRPMAFPRTVRDVPLTFHDAPRAACCAGPLGVLQPGIGAPRIVPDIILVPLLAVDRRGVRLGQGGGHYDRTLAALRQAGRVLAVGVAWDVQIVDLLPAEPWDEPLDALATPSGWRDFAAAPMSRR